MEERNKKPKINRSNKDQDKKSRKKTFANAMAIHFYPSGMLHKGPPNSVFLQSKVLREKNENL